MSNMSNDRQAVFSYLMNVRSQVKVSTFLVTPSGVVDHDYVVVHDAPPRVVKEILTTFAMVGLLEGKGLTIPLTKEMT